MEPRGIEEALGAAEASVASGHGVRGIGFWPAVGRIKGLPELIDRYADRVAAIDQAAFQQWALFIMPVVVGTILMTLATIAGLVLIAGAYYLDGLWAVLVFYAGFGVLLTTTHGLAHLLVGRILGIRFTHWFIGALQRPQPGVKVEYVSYLRTKPARRAWMHGSGALMTKATPFLLIGAAVAADLPAWAVWALPAVGVVTIITDAAWSTKSSDWKRYRREMAFAQDS